MAPKQRTQEPNSRPAGDVVPAAFQDLVNKVLNHSSDRLYLGRSDLAVLVPLSLPAGEPVPTTQHDRGEALQAILRKTVETLRPRGREPDAANIEDRSYLVLRDGFIERPTTVTNKAVYLAIRYHLGERTIHSAISQARRELADRLWGLLVEYVRRADLSPEAWRALETLAVFESGATWTVAEQALIAADVPDPRGVVSELSQRHLLEKREPDGVLLPKAVRLVVYQSLLPDMLQARHRIAGEACRAAGDPLTAARHFRLAEDPPAVATALIPQTDVLIARGQGQELLEKLNKIGIQQLPGPERVALLMARGKAHQAVGQWDEAIACFSQAAPRLAHNRQAWAEVQHRMGKICERQGTYDKAMHHYREALMALEDGPPSGDRLRLWALVQKDRAMIHELQGRHDLALQLCQEALQALGEASDFDVERAELFKAQGTIYRNQGAYADAIACYQHALEFARAGNHVGLQGEAYEGLGIAYDNQGQYLAALDHYERARAFYERLGNPFFIARLTLNIGLIHRHQGAYDQAIAALEDALRAFRQIGDQRGVAIAYTNMAEARLFEARASEDQVPQKRLIEASDYALRAVEICNQALGETADVTPDALRLLADTYGEMGKKVVTIPEEPLTLLRRALRLAQKTKNRYIEAFIEETLGRVLWTRGKHRKACRAYARARDLFAQLGNTEQAERVNSILARLGCEEGMPQIDSR